MTTQKTEIDILSLFDESREESRAGRFSRDGSGRLVYEIFNFHANAYSEKKKELAKEFGLVPFGITICGLDEMFQTYIKGFQRIGIEWDIWSGFIVVAKTKGAEPLVREIGHYLDEAAEDITSITPRFPSTRTR